MVERFGTDPQRLLAMPVRLFWSMAKHVERLKAADELALFDLISLAQCGEAKDRAAFRESLRLRIGTVARREPPRSTREEILAVMQEI